VGALPGNTLPADSYSLTVLSRVAGKPKRFALIRTVENLQLAGDKLHRFGGGADTDRCHLLTAFRGGLRRCRGGARGSARWCGLRAGCSTGFTPNGEYDTKNGNEHRRGDTYDDRRTQPGGILIRTNHGAGLFTDKDRSSRRILVHDTGYRVLLIKLRLTLTSINPDNRAIRTAQQVVVGVFAITTDKLRDRSGNCNALVEK